MDRHLSIMKSGSYVIFNSDNIKPGETAHSDILCPLPIGQLTNQSKHKLIQNTVALGAFTFILGLEFDALKDALTLQFRRKGEEVVNENVTVAKAGFDYAAENFKSIRTSTFRSRSAAMQAGRTAGSAA